ncbi:MAG: trypsin-like peptidase domain-containing protein [Phycisphaerales bacterium]
MRRCLNLLLLALTTLAAPACTSLTLNPSGRIEPLSPALSDQLCCSPLLLAVFGREDDGPGGGGGGGGVIGAGSGIAVHERIILTASHVVPQSARWASLRSADQPQQSQRSRRSSGVRIRSVIRGGGPAASGGDWALLILDRPLSRQGITAAPCLCAQNAPAPPPGTPVLIAGYPFPEGKPPATESAVFSRTPVVVRTTLAAPPPDARRNDTFLYADYAAGRTDLSGLSGGPVFTVPEGGGGEPPVLIGIHIATGVTTFASLTLNRSSLIRRVPTAEIERAIADLPPPR